MLGKLKSLITRFKRDVIEFSPLKGFLLSIEGNGANDPIIITGYNISTVVRTGVGVYRITVSQATMFGQPIGVNSAIINSHTIQPSIVSEAHFVTLVSVSAGVFDIEATEMTVGAGSKLEIAPYDIVSGDGIAIVAFLNLGFGELPPE